MADNIRATPQNPYLGKASEGLRWARDTLDHVPLPDWAGGGLGQALVGKAPEEVNEWSYGNAPMHVPQQGVRMPQMKQGRGEGVMSAAFLPVAEAGLLARGAGKGAQVAGRAATNALMNVGENSGRRQFIKQAGALGGAAVGAAAVPPALRAIGHTLAGDGARAGGLAATKTAAQAVARRGYPEFFAGLNKIRQGAKKMPDNMSHEYDNLLKEAQHADRTAWEALPENRDRIELSRVERERYDALPEDDRWNAEYPVDPWDDVLEMEDPRYLSNTMKARGEYESAAAAQRNALAEQEKAFRAHPDFEGMKTSEEVFEEALNRAGDSRDAYAQAHKARDEHFAKLGGKNTDEEIESFVRAGGKYVDPESGLHAIIEPQYGNFEWLSPRTGNTGRYQHWVHDNYDLPDTFTAPKKGLRDINYGGF